MKSYQNHYRLRFILFQAALRKDHIGGTKASRKMHKDIMDYAIVVPTRAAQEPSFVLHTCENNGAKQLLIKAFLRNRSGHQDARHVE